MPRVLVRSWGVGSVLDANALRPDSGGSRAERSGLKTRSFVAAILIVEGPIEKACG